MADLQNTRENYVLSKLEEWSDKLPYKTLTIHIEMDNKTVTLEKQKQKRIGFNVKGGG